jgi:hypothetical protein
MYNWKMKWAGHVARIGRMRKAYNILVAKPDGKRPLGRPKHRRENNIKMIWDKQDGKLCIGFIRLRIRTSGRLF